MCNLIDNPRFSDSNLANWTRLGAPVYVPGDGNSQLGCVRLAADGDGVEQLRTVYEALPYTVGVAVKGDGAAVALALVNEDGDVAYEQVIGGTADWVETSAVVNLPADLFTIRLSWVSGTVLVDDVSWAHIPATRQQLAQMAHARLSDLATAFSLSYVASGENTEGDYTLAVDATLREMGAVDDRHLPDVRCLKGYEVDEAVSRIEFQMLPILHNKAMLKPTSSRTGQVEDRFNLLGAIEKRMGIVPGQAKTNPMGVISKRMTYG